MSSPGGNVLFVHHSIGRGMIAGGLRDQLATRGIGLWDHDENRFGLTDPDGRRVGRALPVPDDDTDPDGLVRLLRDLAPGGPLAAELAGLDVSLLVLKSCYPNNAFSADLGRSLAEEAAQRGSYRELRDAATAVGLPVLLCASPPVAVEATNRHARHRAVALNRWLAGFWPGPDLWFCDLFSVLAAPSGPYRGGLRWRYHGRRWGDSHLRGAGYRAAARALTESIDRALTRPEAT